MTRFPADLQSAALVDETIAFELSAAAAFFQRQGQLDVAQALQEQGESLLREASRLHSEGDEQRSRPSCDAPTILVVEDEAPLLDVVSSGLSEGVSMCCRRRPTKLRTFC